MTSGRPRSPNMIKPAMIKITAKPSATIIFPSTVQNTISAPMKSTKIGKMRQATALVRPPKCPATEVIRLPREPARLSAKQRMDWPLKYWKRSRRIDTPRLKRW